MTDKFCSWQKGIATSVKTLLRFVIRWAQIPSFLYYSQMSAASYPKSQLNSSYIQMSPYWKDV